MNASRPIAAGACAMFGCLLACTISASDPPTRPPDAESVRAELRAFVEANQSEGENAWPLIERAAAILDEIAREFRHDVMYSVLYDRSFEILGEWDEEIARNTPIAFERAMERGVHDLLLEAAATGRMVMPLSDEKSPALAYAGELSCFRVLTRFQLAVLHAAIDERRFGDAARIAESILFCSRAVSQHPTMYALLVGTANEALLLGFIHDWLVEGAPLPSELLRQWLDAIDRLPLRGVRDHIEIEATMTTANFDAMFDEKGEIPKERQSELLRMLELGLAGDFLSLMLEDGVEESHDEKLPENIARQMPNRRTLAEWMAAAAARTEPLTELPPVRWEPIEAVLHEDHVFAGFVTSMVNVFQNATRARARHETYRQGTRLMIALDLYQNEHDRYPDELSALAPRIVPTVPLDPYTGRSFGYRRNVTEEGETYILYSFGANDTDNGGAACERPQQAWSLRDGDPGCDAVINGPWHD